MEILHWILQGVVRGISQYVTVKYLEKQRTTLRLPKPEWFKNKK